MAVEFSNVKDATLLTGKIIPLSGFERNSEHTITTDADSKRRLPSQLSCIYSDTATMVIPSGDNIDFSKDSGKPFLLPGRISPQDVRTYYRYTHMRADHDAEMAAQSAST